jgi:hypothetical protein
MPQVGFALGIDSGLWKFGTVIAFVGFICLAIGAWCDAMGMLSFQARRPFPSKADHDNRLQLSELLNAMRLLQRDIARERQ